MSRQKRQISRTGLYHIFFNGLSRQNIFEDSSDYEKLKEIIETVKQQMQFELYAYCFMTNHVHLFIKENSPGDISKIMSKILSNYATWYNIKYMRSGTLFSNRYKSEPVEDDRYILGLIRYIHQNPIKAGIVKKASKYFYSSYLDYIEHSKSITDTDFFLNMLDDNTQNAIVLFEELHNTPETDEYDMTDSRKKSAAYINRIITTELGGKSPDSIKSMDKSSRNEIIKMLVTEKGISKSALERATGISRGTIARICEPPKAPKQSKESIKSRNVPFFLD
ncbi:MAG: transposase [Clostridia bacterium]|nr:transposase [Clostridia bacterium]